MPNNAPFFSTDDSYKSQLADSPASNRQDSRSLLRLQNHLHKMCIACVLVHTLYLIVKPCSIPSDFTPTRTPPFPTVVHPIVVKGPVAQRDVQDLLARNGNLDRIAFQLCAGRVSLDIPPLAVTAELVRVAGTGIAAADPLQLTRNHISVHASK